MSDVTTEWEQSAEINEIAAALAKAQAKIKNAKKSSDNPFFKSKYADLAEVTDSCRGPLTENGIAVIQGNISRESKCGVRTMLAHSSGQWMACTALATPKDSGPQATGSVWTYLRRYGLAAMAQVATEDDDGEKAEGRDKNAKPPGASWGKKPANRQSDPADTGEPINAATLEDLRFKATAKFPKGRAARDWLKSITGIDDPAALSEFEAQRALKVLEAAGVKDDFGVLSAETFRRRLEEMLTAVTTARELDIVAGFVERTIEAWAGDKFAVSVTINRAVL